MESLNDKSVVADSDLRADMERWHKNKHKDMRELFVDTAERNVKYYEKVINMDILKLNFLLQICWTTPLEVLIGWGLRSRMGMPCQA